MSDPGTLARIEAKRAALGGGDPGQAARMAEIHRRRAELQAEMDAGNAAWEAERAGNWRLGGVGAPAQAAASPVAMLPPPATTPPATGAPGADEGRSYAGDVLANIGPDAARLAEGAWQGLGEVVDDPLGALRGLGESALGTMQQATVDPRRDVDPRWDFRGDSGLDRYEQYAPHRIGQTFRTRPVQTALDIGGLLALAPGAGPVAGTLARGARHAVDPPRMAVPGEHPRGPTMRPEDVKVATDAGDAVRETVGKMKGAAAEAGKRERGTRAFIEGAPTTEALGKQADVFFEAARKSGVRFSSRDFGPFRRKLVRTLRGEGADKVLHPKIDRLVKLIEDAPPGITPDMGNLMILRRQFGAAASDLDKSTSRLGSIGVDLIDDFVEGGSAPTSAIMKDANRLWARMRKSETIERAIAKADTAQQGFEAGLRAEFKSIYRGIIDGNKKYRGFTPDEVKAIKAVAQGNFTANTLRRIASLSGGSGPQRAMQNLLQGGAVGGGLGFAVGGPAGAAVGAGIAPLAGHVAGRMAERGTLRRANLARAMAARGETPAQARKAPQDSTLAELMSGYMETRQ